MAKSRFTVNELNDFSKSRSLEWIETNGLGGYASSTVSGANSRRYHGLLVAAIHPPVERCVILSKLEETLLVKGQYYNLSSNQYPGAVYPQGFQYLKSFERDVFPEFIFEAGGAKLKKTIAAIHGENTTLVIYEVLNAPEKFKMELLPLCSYRDFHSISHENDFIFKGYIFNDGIFQTKNYHESAELFISVPDSEFENTQCWYNRFEYSIEQERGLDFQEDLFNHGKFIVELKKGSKLGIIISTEDPAGRNAFEFLSEEEKRRVALIKSDQSSKELRQLFLAADQFVVKRGDDLRTIIAGYHWFSDWGRDTMIAMPGLCFATQRFDDAKKIIRAFANNVSDGMLPNRFADYGEACEYNTVDATLWFFNAIYKYYKYTADKDLVKSMLPVLKDIIDWHDKGTRFNIHVDTDGLIYAGKDGVQLTWMDAKVGDWVVTPRRGKAVEINALWYNALRVMEELMRETGSEGEAKRYEERAGKVNEKFNEVFWNNTQGGLYDFVDGEIKNDDIRPNQIYALSLPFPVVVGNKAKKILELITSKLLTPRGLRSLASNHNDYKSEYLGDGWHRDAAYHQGTAWSFLIGPYVDALIKLKGKNGKTEASALISSFFEHLNEAGVGTISEIFDAEPPHQARGCIAQAWGVAEVLRVILEHELLPGEKLKTKVKTPSVNRVAGLIKSKLDENKD
jgi:predicted glycogen debranching enzyme